MTIEEQELEEQRIIKGLRQMLETRNLNSDEREIIQATIKMIGGEE